MTVKDQSKSLTYDWERDFSYDSSVDSNGLAPVLKFYHTDKENEACILRNKDSIFFGKTQWDIFTCAMAVGKKYNLRKPLKKRSNSIPVANAREEHIVQVLSVAFSEDDGDLSILQNPEKIRTICEEYANGGVLELIEWHTMGDSLNPWSEYEKELEKLFNIK